MANTCAHTRTHSQVAEYFTHAHMYATPPAHMTASRFLSSHCLTSEISPNPCFANTCTPQHTNTSHSSTPSALNKTPLHYTTVHSYSHLLVFSVMSSCGNLLRPTPLAPTSHFHDGVSSPSVTLPRTAKTAAKTHVLNCNRRPRPSDSGGRLKG